MPMKIRQVREYFPNGGYRSPYKGGGDVNTLFQQDVSVQSIRAVLFQNLQMYARSYSGAALIKVRGSELLNVSSANAAYVLEFSFDQNLIPINIVQNTYATYSNTTGQTNFLSKISSLPTNKYFAIVLTGNNTISTTIKTKLLEIGALYSIEVNGAVTFVAIGYNGKIIDSMWNGCDVGGASQVYVNGQNASIGKTVRRADSLDGNGNPVSSYVVSLPQTGGKYYQVELSSTDSVDVDYIIFNHNSNIPPYIIQNHKITVVDSSGQEYLLKQPSNGYVETVHGSRLYVFGQLQSDTFISGGNESSISLSAMNSALNRFRNQATTVGFFDEPYLSTLNQTIYNNFNLFSNLYAAESVTDNNGKIESNDIIPLIKNSERIKYSLAGCNSGCSTSCFDECTVTCKISCGIGCGDACEMGCTVNCHTGCKATCGGACASVCGGQCNTACAALCAGGTCGSNCESVCIGVCGGTCASTCGDNCSGNCKGSCSGDYLGPCFDCSGACSNNCWTGCSGVCSTACSTKTCGNNCYATCGNTTCNHLCGSACATACGSACASNSCVVSCSRGCSTTCVTMCGNSCSTSCTNSCTGTCLNTAQSGFALRPPVYI